VTHTATIVSSTLEARLRALENRVAALAAALEPLPATRPTEQAGAPADELLAILTRLTAQIANRESTSEWDAADYLATRVMLRTLASLTLEFRRLLAESAAALETGATLSREATDLADRIERQITATLSR
jgi:hypothetical protein